MTDPDRSVRVDVRLKRAIESGTLPKSLVVVGPAGTGKTHGILTFLHVLAADYPRLRILIVRQTRASLTDSVMKAFEEDILPADGMGSIAANMSRRHRQAYDYPNGSEIVLGGMDNPTRIASTAWDLAFFNELIESEEEAYEIIGSRLNRPGRFPWLGYFFGDTNPGDPSHWLKKRIDEGTIAAWDTVHQANPAMFRKGKWTEAGQNYLDSLARLTGTRRKRLLEGVWAAGEGQWFETFGEHHISEAAEYHPAFPVHLAVDSGVQSGAVWFQVRPGRDGDMITVFGDYFAFSKPAYVVAIDVIERTMELTGTTTVDRGVTDPAGVASSPIGPTVLGEYARAGLFLEQWPRYPGSVNDGLQLIESFVAVDPPALLVHPRCVHMINAFHNYKRMKKAGHYIDRPMDEQHPFEELMDSIRGGLQDRYPNGRRPQPVFRRLPARRVV